jgi:predicted ABC-type exoprotein transport system permease subunit
MSDMSQSFVIFSHLIKLSGSSFFLAAASLLLIVVFALPPLFSGSLWSISYAPLAALLAVAPSDTLFDIHIAFSYFPNSPWSLISFTSQVYLHFLHSCTPLL